MPPYAYQPLERDECPQNITINVASDVWRGSDYANVIFTTGITCSMSGIVCLLAVCILRQFGIL